MAKPGRKPACTAERTQRMCKVIAGGGTYDQAIKIGGIAEATFYRWMEENKEFKEAIQNAKAQYDEWTLNGILESAKTSLKVLVEGTEFEEVKTEYENDKEGNPRIKKQTRVTKKIMPNPTAVIFALCNRDPEHWQNRVNQELSGKIETETKQNVSLSNVPDDLLAQVINAINGK